MTDRSDALIPALKRFQDAVSALVDTRCEIVDGKRLYLDSLYIELYDSLAGQQGYGGDHYPRSLPILWIDCFDTLARIDQTVAKWLLNATQGADPPDPRIPATVNRLQALSDAKWRPQDADLLTDRAGQLEAFAKTIKSLLLPQISFFLYGRRCPICNQDFVRRTDVTGAAMTVPALSIQGDSALCGECRRVWRTIPELRVLGRMLEEQSVGS